MPKFIKISLIAIMTTIVLMLTWGAAKSLLGGYLSSNLFTGILMLIGIGLVIWLFLKGSKWIWGLPIFLLTFQSCDYAKSNQQVVVSEDCGMSWKKIKAGDAVPRAGVNRCYMKVVMPNFPMQGESKFIANLKERVRASVHIDYDYSIMDPLEFINQAKYLGKANSDADSGDALDPSAFEGAENMVIDKRIKDVAKNIFIHQDIVELDQSDIEEQLLVECNKVLDPLGVQLNFITLTFDLDDQTRQAIDVSTAMKIYTSKNLEDVGRQVMIERAGATKITVESRSEK
jgi:hypothetical protein